MPDTGAQENFQVSLIAIYSFKNHSQYEPCSALSPAKGPAIFRAGA
jgi:hypothetical protein